MSNGPIAAGYSTELLLSHYRNVEERVRFWACGWRGVCRFKKVIDSVSHAILEKKLKNSFGFEGNLLAWVKSYMNRRKQFTIVNGNVSTKVPIKFGIPQGSVLGPTLFVLFTNDLPSKVTEGTVYMYADDTTLYCIGRRADEIIKSLNLALRELYTWCITNKLTPQKERSTANFKNIIKWVTQTRLLGITVDIKLSWSARSRFLPSDLLLTFYSKVILPSVTYGLIVWGGCNCQDILNSLEILHCRAARIIFNLPRDMSTLEVLSRSKWTTLEHHY